MLIKHARNSAQALESSLMSFLMLAIHWTEAHTAVFGALVALLATVIGAIIAAFVAIRVSQGANYQRMHELLVSAPVASGRKKLFIAHKNQDWPKPDDNNSDWDEINQALALFDTLGVYMQQWWYLPDKTVLKFWYHPIKNLIEPADAFQRYRRETLRIHQNWVGFSYLTEKVKRYECKCSSCESGLAIRLTETSQNLSRSNP